MGFKIIKFGNRSDVFGQRVPQEWCSISDAPLASFDISSGLAEKKLRRRPKVPRRYINSNEFFEMFRGQAMNAFESQYYNFKLNSVSYGKPCNRKRTGVILSNLRVLVTNLAAPF